MTLTGNTNGDPVTFLSAADQTYSRCLRQLLLSAMRRGYVEGYRWIAYDLGMEPATRAELEQRFPWCEFRTQNFAHLPAHFQPKAGSYAWKPLIVWEVAAKAASLVCWMDSANIIKGSLDPMFQRTERTGLFILSGQPSLADQCDPLVMAKGGLPRTCFGSRELVTGVLCVDPRREAIRTILREWHDKAFDQDAIRPAVLTKPLHKNDQALLSCLIYGAAEREEIVLEVDDVDISSPRPVTFLSTRNKIPAWMPAAADPVIRAWYTAAKFLDQTAHRIDRWHSRVDPLGWRNERYAVVVQRGPGGAEQVVPCPPHRYFADPFLWEHEGRISIFVEDFRYLANRATIAVVELDEQMRPTKPAQTVLDPGCHASFPFLFRHGAETFMVPETSRNGAIDLYRCERFPDQWVRLRRLLDRVDAADTVLFPHDGRWWLMTSLSSPNSGASMRYLAVFHADDPTGGGWTPHPVNAQALYIDRKYGFGRNAGAVVADGGRLFRPMQSSQRHYGESFAMMEIVELNEERFVEVPATAPHPHAAIAGRPGVHHVSEIGDAACWDVRVVGSDGLVPTRNGPG